MQIYNNYIPHSPSFLLYFLLLLSLSHSHFSPFPSPSISFFLNSFIDCLPTYLLHPSFIGSFTHFVILPFMYSLFSFLLLPLSLNYFDCLLSPSHSLALDSCTTATYAGYILLLLHQCDSSPNPAGGKAAELATGLHLVHCSVL